CCATRTSPCSAAAVTGPRSSGPTTSTTSCVTSSPRPAARATDPLGDHDDHGQQPSRRNDGAHPVSAGGRRRGPPPLPRAPRHDDLTRDLPGRSGAALQPLLALRRPPLRG